jgi:hypothetical protein
MQQEFTWLESQLDARDRGARAWREVADAPQERGAQGHGFRPLLLVEPCPSMRAIPSVATHRLEW